MTFLTPLSFWSSLQPYERLHAFSCVMPRLPAVVADPWCNWSCSTPLLLDWQSKLLYLLPITGPHCSNEVMFFSLINRRFVCDRSWLGTPTNVILCLSFHTRQRLLCISRIVGLVAPINRSLQKGSADLHPTTYFLLRQLWSIYSLTYMPCNTLLRFNIADDRLLD